MLPNMSDILAMSCKHFFALVMWIWGIFWLGCVHRSSQAPAEAQDISADAQKELKPILQLITSYRNQHRQVASDQGVDRHDVKVYQRDETITKLPEWGVGAISGELTPTQIEEIKDYIVQHIGVLGVNDPRKSHLELKSITAADGVTYVRFTQSVERLLYNQEYLIPIEGGSIVVVLKDGNIKEIYNHLLNPPQFDRVVKAEGIELAFSDSEFSQLMWQFKTNEEARGKISRYMTGLAKFVGKTFDTNGFFNRKLSEQRAMLQSFFSVIGEDGTLTFMIGLARHKQLSYVKHGLRPNGRSKWMMMVSEYFNLPIEFDVELPEDDVVNRKLVFRNLRLMHHELAEVNSYVSPFYPNGKKTLGGDSADRAAVQMQKVLQYYQKNFGWNSYRGKDSTNPIEIHTMLRSPGFAENAAWIGKIEKFVIGQGGETIANMTDSVSVLGHEYAHAIVQFSSGLVYRGEPGAINEHFADIQGASIEAEFNNNGRFGFTIGTDILTPQTVATKQNVLNLILTRYNFNQATINNFSLYKPTMRHLYAPLVSFTAQIEHMDEYRRTYPVDCQPSMDNDNCGVHTASGILNRAASLAIGVLGFEKTKGLFFNTVVNRLNATSRFNDYLLQLFNECKADVRFSSQDCDVVLASFAKVGIQHSLLPSPELAPMDVTKSIALNGNAQQTQFLLSRQEFASLTPSVKICGFVDVEEDVVEIEDGKIFPLIVKANHSMRSQGEFKHLVEGSCACVSGSLTHTYTADGKMRSAFANFHVSGSQCTVDSLGRVRRYARGKGPQDPRLRASSATFCGWIKVDSDRNQIQVIDNKFDVFFKTTEQQQSMADQLQGQQCGCVTGAIEKQLNASGIPINRFRAESVKSVQIKTVEDCSPIKWK